MQAFFSLFLLFPPLSPIYFRNKGLQDAVMPEAIVSYTVLGLDDRRISWRGLRWRLTHRGDRCLSSQVEPSSKISCDFHAYRLEASRRRLLLQPKGISPC